MSGMAWWRNAVGLGETEAELIARRDRLIVLRMYCTVANPQTGCTPLRGIAKPMTATCLANFKALQHELNRILAVKGKATMALDGRIGPATLKAMDVARSAASISSAFWLPQKTVDEVAFGAASGTITSVVRALANTLKAPNTIVETTPSPPSVPRADGGVTHPPDQQIVASASPPIDLSMKSPLVLAALAVGALLLLRGKGKGKRSRRRR